MEMSIYTKNIESLQKLHNVLILKKDVVQL